MTCDPYQILLTSGVRLRLTDGHLVLVADSGGLTPELRAEIRPHKAALKLAADWLAEVTIMKNGTDPDWLSWSPASRETWARQMVELAKAEGFYELVTQNDRDWLKDF